MAAKIKTETWLPYLLGTVILGTLGFLSVKVTDMTGLLGGIQAKMSATSERIDRIASALPVLQVQVAEEELNREFKTAVVTSRPLKTAAGEWKAKVEIVNLKEKTSLLYGVTLPAQDDKRAFDAMLGAGYESDSLFRTFSSLKTYAGVVHKPSRVPTFIDQDVSFALSNTDASDYVKKIGWVFTGPPTKTTIKMDGRDWNSIIDHVANLQTEFQAP
jgi:hypothetical protein